MKKISIIGLIIFILDQIVKLAIGFSIPLNRSKIIIKDFFSISNVHNYGAAFSIFYGNRILLIIVSLLALFLIYFFILRNLKNTKLEIITYSLLIGGILGNLLDRIIYGYVVDFFDFKIFGYNFPVFNIADICIVCSAILIIADTLRGYINENRSRKKWYKTR